MEMTGGCHCGAVRFSVTLGIENPRRCNCSLCRMRGAVVVTARYGDLSITAGERVIKLYRFNTMKAEHWFCAKCGIYTHHRRRSNPDELSVNVACLDGVSPFDFGVVPVYDGMVHPGDRPGDSAYRIAGWLRYEEGG